MTIRPYSDLNRRQLSLLLTFPTFPVICTVIALSLLTVQIQAGVITRPNSS